MRSSAAASGPGPGATNRLWYVYNYRRLPPHFTGRLGEIKAPELVAGGTRDRVVPPELLRAIASGITGARLLLLPGRGHASALCDPRLKPTIAAFLAEPV